MSRGRSHPVLRWVAILGVAQAYLSGPAWAFPEMVRHGYVNCTSCHASPTGGGLLNEYGRALSRELLSHGRFFFERAPGAPPAEHAPGESPMEAESTEQEFLHGAVSLPNWLQLGGHLRVLQLFKDTPTETVGRFIPMQLDLEAMVQPVKQVSILATLGRSNPRITSGAISDFFVSRRHWLQFGFLQTTYSQALIRLGRFFPAYGLQIAEHTSFTRRNLGFDQERESYNLEASWIGDRLSITGTWILGRPDRASLSREEGFSLQGTHALGNHSKLGLNAYTGLAPGSSPENRRSMLGVFGIVGITPQFYALAEWDGSYSDSLQWGWMNYAKFGWEADQGLHFYLSQEFSQPSRVQPGLFLEAYTAGIQYFPRPHWEFLAAFRKERNTGVSLSFDTAIWLLAHYYL